MSNLSLLCPGIGFTGQGRGVQPDVEPWSA
jgi:hypothetical protein